MPITHQLRPNERVLILVHVGAVNDEEFLSFYKALYEDTIFDNSFNMLVDLRQTDSTVRSSAALNELSDFIRKKYAKTTVRPKVAVVAPENISFGLARMYEAFSDDVPWDFVVFRVADAALAWLGLPESLINDLH